MTTEKLTQSELEQFAPPLEELLERAADEQLEKGNPELARLLNEASIEMELAVDIVEELVELLAAKGIDKAQARRFVQQHSVSDAAASPPMAARQPPQTLRLHSTSVHWRYWHNRLELLFENGVDTPCVVLGVDEAHKLFELVSEALRFDSRRPK